MYPSWLTVEYASTRLMSVCTSPMVAAKTAVITPTQSTTSRATVERSKSAWLRATMYTPAVTMVAAWMRAETGVGPSMASGSRSEERRVGKECRSRWTPCSKKTRIELRVSDYSKVNKRSIAAGYLRVKIYMM